MAIFTTQPAPTRGLSSKHQYVARISAAARPVSVSPAVSQHQTATAIEQLHLITIGPFQDHCYKTFKDPFQDHLNLPKTIIQPHVKKIQKQEALLHRTSNTLPQNTNEQNE